MEHNLFAEDNLYGILARVLGLTQNDKGIFTDKNGQKYILTKYGFGPIHLQNSDNEIVELKLKLQDSKATEKHLRNELQLITEEFITPLLKRSTFPGKEELNKDRQANIPEDYAALKKEVLTIGVENTIMNIKMEGLISENETIKKDNDILSKELTAAKNGKPNSGNQDSVGQDEKDLLVTENKALKYYTKRLEEENKNYKITLHRFSTGDNTYETDIDNYFSLIGKKQKKKLYKILTNKDSTNEEKIKLMTEYLERK
jgi:hypothetical protein